LYSDLEKQNAYSVFGKWKTRQAMEAHFKREKFPVLMGAARVLGEDFEMSIGETLEKGSYPLISKNKGGYYYAKEKLVKTDNGNSWSLIPDRRFQHGPGGRCEV
jgi:hypothetical protein